MEDLTIRPNMSNEEIDERVEKAVLAGCTKFNDICIRLGLVTYRCDFRSVDKSLQRLRRAGKIHFDKKEQGWHAAA